MERLPIGQAHEELWSEEYASWNQYLKERAEDLVGRSFVQAVKFVRAAEVAKRLPQNRIVDDSVLTPSHLGEIGRLAPDKPSGNVGNRGGGREKDYSRLRKQDVGRVLKKATELAGGKEPSVRDVRKAVDHDLGIDRSEKAKETKEAKAAGLAVCALDLMARAGEVIEDMQAKGELIASTGRPKKSSQAASITDLLGSGAKDKSSRYKTAMKADRNEYIESLDRERDKPSSRYSRNAIPTVNLKFRSGYLLH